MSARGQIITSLAKATGIENIKLEVSEIELHGDYSSNVAMATFSRVKEQGSERARGKNTKYKILDTKFKTPRELAEHIISKLSKDKELSKSISEIEVAGPGFINFHLTRPGLVNTLKQYSQARFDIHSDIKGKKISVEYTDPNPFKEFHIGHLYSNLIGESLSNILEANGAIVWRGNFYGDVGMHVAKSVWGTMKNMEKESVTLVDLKKKTLSSRQKFLGKGYSLGVIQYDESKKAKEEIGELNSIIYWAAQKILEKKKEWKPIVDYEKYIENTSGFETSEVLRLYEAGLEWSLEYFETIYKKLGTKFDGYYPESWTGELGMQVVEEGLKKKVLEKSKGVVVYKGEQDGLHTRVFVNKLGFPTYETKDLGLAEAKYIDFKYDLSINVFGKEIDEYYKVVKAALTRIRPALGKKSTHIAHGMVNLPEGKMSSRTGNVITYLELVDMVKNSVLEAMKDSDIKSGKKQKISQMIAHGAIKYSFLKSNIGGNITFDISSSVNFNGNSGPYLQYTYARCRSVLRKSRHTFKDPVLQGVYSNEKLSTEELSLLRTFIHYSEVIQTAAERYAPNLLCNYLYDLAQKYNSFYNRDKIIGAENQDFRLLLTKATANTLKHGLGLLGIQAPEKM